MMGDIIQFNVRGLKTVDLRVKKVDFISKILDEQHTLFLSLQETRLTDYEQIPSKLIHYKHLYHIFFCGATNQDQGSGILIFVKKTEDILKTSTLIQGRLAHVQSKNKVTGNVLNLFSFYGKSNVDSDFANNLISKLDNEISNDNLENNVICGDFNFVTSTIDRNTNHFTQTDNIYRNKWNIFEIKNDLLDVFRKIYPTRRLYSFSQSGGNSKSRIDRVYTSSNMSGRVQKVIFENRDESDHKLIRLKLEKQIEIGKGTYIFNNTRLENETFVNEFSKIIKIYTNNNKRIHFPNNRVTWDFMKMEMMNFSKEFSKKLAREGQKEINIVRNQLEILESTPKERITNEIKNEIDRLKLVEGEYNAKVLKGHKIRSKVPHMEEGEGNISYYSKLENRKGEENLIFSLENEDGQIMEGTENIKQIVFEFFEKLYKDEPENESYQDEFLENIEFFFIK